MIIQHGQACQCQDCSIRRDRNKSIKHDKYIVELGAARALFFSADPGAQVVGGTASLLLECDEAQDVRETKWDKDFEPMAASTNATVSNA